MHQEAAAAWDQHAPTYARLFEPLTGFIARSMLHMVESRLPPKAALLDIACGTGALALPAVRRALRERETTGSSSIIVATDFSAKMVELTRQAAAALGAGKDTIRCEVQNGEALTFADATFDASFRCSQERTAVGFVTRRIDAARIPISRPTTRGACAATAGRPRSS